MLCKDARMRRSLFVMSLAVTLWTCRYIGPLAPLRSDNRLPSTGPTSDPTRQAPLTSRRCLVECGPGYVCNEPLAECELAKRAVLDGGPSWLPQRAP